MKKGDIVLCQVKSPYGGKARPCVVVQSDEVIDVFESVTICPITSYSMPDVTSFRIKLSPNKTNQLQKESYVMVDKVGSYPRGSLKPTGAKLTPAVIRKVDTALAQWLALPVTEIRH